MSRSLLFGLGAIAVALPAVALSTSVDGDGIDARRLQAEPFNLTGKKIAIGQVEIGRPSQFGIDKLAVENSPFQVWRIFEINGPAIPDEAVDGHASNVASVMISNDKTFRGVAPDAYLYSAAIGDLTEFTGQQEECLASQHVALQNSGDVRATNFSFGEPLSRDERPNATLDGNALLTQCIDWSSRVHKLLYVIAGNQGRGGIPIPTDNFNGINVAYSRRVQDGRFVRVDAANLTSEPPASATQGPSIESNVGPRRSINLVAPGSEIEMFDPNGTLITSSGTSFAAPHVVATVALLQEFGDRQFREGASNWSLDSREPLVMKSVILNSADKLEDTGDGLLLGMARTLLDEKGKDWTESDAYSSQEIPLHAELGTGHLNAFRAYEQLAAGQWAPGSVPAVGWSYSTLESDTEDYLFDAPLIGGSYINATLSWERTVELNSDDDYYDVGESFTGRALSNLDLYLMPADADDINQSVWSSVSTEDSLEHIFIPIPQTGRYKLRVVQKQNNSGEAQPYSLAWWAASEQSSVPQAAPTDNTEADSTEVDPDGAE